MLSYPFTLWYESEDCTQVYKHMLAQIDEMLEAKWDVDVVVRKHVKTKTTSQRGWFHYLCGLFGEAMGIDKGVVKDIAKAQLLGWRHVRVGGIDIPVPDGSSEDLGRLEYSEMIEALYRLAAESGVVLPNPDFRKRVGE